MKYEHILLAHGGGGLLTSELIREVFLPAFTNPLLAPLADGALMQIGQEKLCLTTDSYVVHPLFFPGGNIGSLAVHGTVNDVSMCGGVPLYLSAGFILEEGFPLASLREIIQAMAAAAREAQVHIVTGDTKVVAKGAADGLFINTAGVGVIRYPSPIATASIQPGDVIILNGNIGDHGAALVNAREGFGFAGGLESDSAPLNHLVAAVLAAVDSVHAMRDCTRGGLGTILAEMAEQSGMVMEIDETRIPVRETVRGFCEVLGFDPLFLANEGKMVLFCPERDGDKALEVMRHSPHGADAAIIGRVGQAAARGRVIMRNAIGGSREITPPAHELLPRIC
ncbi:MAG: hydrogenase expression/formation protein HypE [Desulfobulbaceae bacterium]|jgi:hydrogenase expression/formation protein HypE|nr:hydrogenase expression/formation protein HypE [Desulfobulbaceae bacterium]